jgi:DNA-binding NarL/FixJ family response regulator
MSSCDHLPAQTIEMQPMEPKRWEVVLAEDDREDVLIFELASAEANLLINVRHAVNGDVLFTLLQEAVPDILFLDIHMPCKDGLTCIAEIRSNPAYNDLPVIMYSSYKSRKTIESAYEAGANLYLLKSQTITDLAEHLKNIFAIEWRQPLHKPSYNQFILGKDQ